MYSLQLLEGNLELIRQAQEQIRLHQSIKDNAIASAARLIKEIERASMGSDTKVKFLQLKSKFNDAR